MSLYGWNDFQPTTPVELWQERREEMYAREEAEINRRPLERREILWAEWCERDRRQNRLESEEAEEPDPVTAVDRWEWAGIAWCEIDTSRLHMMTPEERDRVTEPVVEYVERQARKKRDEYFGETRKELIELYSKVKGE